MRLISLLLLILLAQTPAPSQAPATYERRFATDTMRVDVFHTGGPGSGEVLALDRVVNDGPWSGSRTQLVDGTNLGPYLFEVRDKASGTLLLLARVCVDLRGVGNDGRGEEGTADVSRVAAVPLAETACVHNAEEAAAGQQLRPAMVDRCGSGLAVREPRTESGTPAAGSQPCSRTGRRRSRWTSC